MGLDIHLVRYKTDPKQVAALRAEAEAKGSAIEAEFAGDESEGAWERQKARNLAAGLDAYGGLDDRDHIEQIERPSAVYPDHMCSIGYLRSSYNDAGTNRVLERFTGRTLYDVLYPTGNSRDGDTEDGHVVVDWAAALVRAQSLRDDFAKALADRGPYDVLEESPNMFSGLDILPRDAMSAMALFQAQRETMRRRADSKDEMSGCDYTNRDGYYSPGGLTVHAIIPGIRRSPLSGADWPTTWIVYEVKPYKSQKTGQMEPPFTWYRQATEIVVEMCEWVLGQERPDIYRLYWSS